MADPENRARAVERIRAWENTRLDAARAYALLTGFPLRQILPDGRVQELIGLDDSGEPVVRTTTNVNAAISTGANLLRSAPYLLDGSGLTVGVWDGGAVRATHQEFGIRATIQDSSTVIDHATHVAGTIGAAGINPALKGMAPAVLIDSYNWTNDTSEQNNRGAAYPGESGKIYLSNHSYGNASGWNYTSDTGGVNAKWLWSGNGTTSTSFDAEFGKYNPESANSDSTAYAYPYYLIFRSAGNDRTDNPVNGDIVSLTTGTTPTYTYNSATHPPGDGHYKNTGYDTIHDDAAAKNVVTIGSVGDAVSGGNRSTAGAYMSSYSSWGPTDDGRIKPDLVANGEAVTSALATSDTASGGYSGTSMATPNATGSAALVVQAYRQLFPGHYPRASTLKGLLIQTADDLGNPGPDYKFGWGLVNAKAAVDKLQGYKDFPGTPHLVEDRLVTSTRTSVSHAFTWDGSSPIRVTLCWTDPVGTAVSAGELTDNRTAKLVNNLNLTLSNPSGGTHLPYVMPHVGDWTTATLNSHAVTGVNHTDNVEQVYLASPEFPGVYTATVDFSGSLTNSVQNFSLLISGAASTPTGPSPSLATVSPNVSTGAAMTLNLTGANLRAGCTAKLSFPGQPDVALGNLEPLGDTLKSRFNAAGMVPGRWNVIVTNPDGQSATLPEAFDVIGNLWFVNLEGDTSGWTHLADLGTDAWTLSTAQSKSPTKSFFCPCPTTVSDKSLLSPNVHIPAGTSNLSFRFWHRYTFQNNKDGGMLEFSLDGGPWFDVTSSGSGASLTSGPYNGTINSTSNPYHARGVWTSSASSFSQVVVTITNPTLYQGKTLRARWRLTSNDNTATASSGWYVDDIALVGSPSGNSAPVLASPAASPATVTASTTALSVTASDNAGEPALTYSWSSDGPAPVTFSANNSNAAQNTTATFTQPGAYTFTVTATDAGDLTDSDTVAVSVTAVPVSLAVSPPAATVTNGASQNFAAAALDQFGQSISATFAWSVSGGGTISPAGLFTAGETAGGPHTVTASVGSVSNTASVTVTEPNLPPVADADAFVLNEDGVLVLDAANGLLTNDVDPNPADTLTAELVEGPASGNLTLNPDGSLTFVSATNQSGVVTFTYRVSDGTVFSALATVTMTVTPVNDAPVAMADAFTTGEDTPLNVPVLTGLLANDSDVENSPLTAVLATSPAPAEGAVTLNPDGSFDFIPAANFHGTTSFSYTVSDANLISAPATVTVTVAPVNDAPVAVADAYTTDEDTPLIVPVLTGLLANDSDPDPTDTLTVELVEGPASGTLTFNPDGSLTFVSATNQSGVVTFTYRVTDGTVFSDPATVTLTVNPVNDAPLAVADTYAVDEDATLNVPVLTGLLDNDTDTEGSPLTTSLATSPAPAEGAATLASDGSFTFTPAENFHGTTSFTYTVSDGELTSTPATVTITVNQVIPRPVAVADVRSTVQGQVLNLTAAFGVLLNDSSPNSGAVLSAQLVSPPSVEEGTVSLSPDGSLSFVPAPGFAGASTFTYRVSDTFAVSDPATVTINVEADSDADGLSDTWESSSFGNLDHQPDADDDGDGVSNLAELAANTNPLDRSDALRPVLESPSGLFQLSFPTKPGVLYRVETSPAPGSDAVWTPMTGPALVGDGTARTVSLPAPSPSVFVRVLTVRN